MVVFFFAKTRRGGSCVSHKRSDGSGWFPTRELGGGGLCSELRFALQKK